MLRRVRAALPVGADGRVGAAPSLFAALQAAREAPRGAPLVVDGEGVAEFLAPLPAGRLPLAPDLVAALQRPGARARWARWPPCRRRPPSTGWGSPACARGAWRAASPGARRGRAVRRRRCAPPSPSPSRWASLPALEAAARLLLGELAGAARGRGAALRALALRARLADGGSWARDVALREATADPDRLALAALPRLGEVTGPVTELWIGGDASGRAAGHQLTAIPSPGEERRSRAREAIRQVRAAQGPEAMLRAVELEPWSRLPERRWALTPYEP